MKICIIGSGMSGAILASELIHNKDFEILLVDVDSIDNSFNSEDKLEIYADKQLLDQETVGYGFGGTTNLWHGVLSPLDKEDLDGIDNCVDFNISSEIRASSNHISKYYKSINMEKIHEQAASKNIESFLKLDNFKYKNYYVQKLPFRSREYIKNLSNSVRNLTLIENAVGISLEFLQNIKCNSLVYSKDRITHKLNADIYIVCCGALESPRILLQSLKNKPHFLPKLGKGLIDHPHTIVGIITLPKKIFYKSHGGTSSSMLSPYRIGCTINKDVRNTKSHNHSLFFRPHLGNDHDQWRRNIKTLLKEKISYNLIKKIFLQKDFLSTIFILLSEKFGFGVYTNKIAVSVQLEHIIDEGGEIELSDKIDQFGRSVPRINRTFPKRLKDDIKAINILIERSLKNGAMYSSNKVKHSDLLSGAHHSGTCRMGTENSNSVVNKNLKVHNIDNLYVCDASVIPKIGNANLSIAISSFAIRLAKYISKKLEKNG